MDEREERRLVIYLFLHSCIVELPENVHDARTEDFKSCARVIFIGKIFDLDILYL